MIKEYLSQTVSFTTKQTQRKPMNNLMDYRTVLYSQWTNQIPVEKKRSSYITTPVCTKMTFFACRQAFLFRPRNLSRALGRWARRGAACTLGAILGPGRAPWRVFSAFEVAKTGK